MPCRGPASLPGCVWLWQRLSGCHRPAVSLLALNVSSLTQTIALLWGSDPCFSSSTLRGQVQSSWHSCMVLHVLFHWSGPPVCSQLVLCMHVCVSRCIPGVSMERDVLHIHLLLCHLVLFCSPSFFFFFCTMVFSNGLIPFGESKRTRAGKLYP